ncbi:hypothetical protein DTL21_13445 [Bremerella cremea]|uniref:Uncharacterized protein n=1 Tax=Blastopirellula marina TaxID=124 RepID=A0A2S8FQQ8_9BACT|nr:hypothetical protein C5Y83_13440 [Blastopirellula marina]RCS47012.1 hypothetical protein DTL21_13445 [Bremerella cremea]
MLHGDRLLFGLALSDTLLHFPHQTTDFGERITRWKILGWIGTKPTRALVVIVTRIWLTW